MKNRDLHRSAAETVGSEGENGFDSNTVGKHGSGSLSPHDKLLTTVKKDPFKSSTSPSVDLKSIVATATAATSHPSKKETAMKVLEIMEQV
ncbi:UNVERIFIED_CONTAM: hypothetical protein HDU68_002507 [Siphonaria sp. JEL0065]|nr:hypothetical protein HDU68_002507 [Siphonaria sp. JEL0065]